MQLFDTPGHRDFFKNASAGVTAGTDVGLLVVAVPPGEFEVSVDSMDRDHIPAVHKAARMLRAAGVRSLVVVVNKSDRIAREANGKQRFEEVVEVVKTMLARCGWPRQWTRKPQSGKSG